MLIQQKVSILVPNIELGSLIAERDAQVQAQVLSGFARTQLLKCKWHSQPIIDLANLLSPETFIWLERLYEESKKRQWTVKNKDSDTYPDDVADRYDGGEKNENHQA